jgi:WD40 repeat protein
LYAACQDTRVHIWDKKILKQVGVLEGHSNPVINVVADEKFIYTGSLDNTVRVWRKGTLKQFRVLDVRGWVQCLAINENYVY